MKFHSLITIAAIALGPPASVRSQVVDTAITKASVLRADSLLNKRAQRIGPTVLLARLTPNAALLFTGQPIFRGAREARAAFIARYARPASYSWKSAAAIASVDGRLACTIGFSRFRPAAAPPDSMNHGIYITCWTRAADGRWQIAGHQRNDSPVVDGPSPEQVGISPAPHSATTLTGMASTHEAQDTDSLFAVFAGLPEGPGVAFARNAAADAVLLGALGFPHGPEKILAAFAEFPADRVLRWQPSRNFGAGSGGLAFTVGNSVTTSRDGRTDRDRRGKFLTIWRRETDGTWKYVYDLGSPRP